MRRILSVDAPSMPRARPLDHQPVLRMYQPLMQSLRTIVNCVQDELSPEGRDLLCSELSPHKVRILFVSEGY